jgi:hypothetical protein
MALPFSTSGNHCMPSPVECLQRPSTLQSQRSVNAERRPFLPAPRRAAGCPRSAPLLGRVKLKIGVYRGRENSIRLALPSFCGLPQKQRLGRVTGDNPGSDGAPLAFRAQRSERNAPEGNQWERDTGNQVALRVVHGAQRHCHRTRLPTGSARGLLPGH